MHWKFEKMFTIRAMHESLPDQPADAATEPPVFSLQPSASTALLFKRLGWISKPTWDGLMVFAERGLRSDQSLMPAKRPGPDRALSFVLCLNTPAILKKTKPYMKMNGTGAVPNNALPAFSGRGRLLYFNNLNVVTQTDGSLRITVGPFVDLPEFASRAPTIFEFPAAQVGVSNVEATAILPNPPPGSSFAFKPFSSKTQVELPENAYKMVQKPSGVAQGETIYLSNEILPDNALGIVSIFDIASAPIDQNKTFQLAFAKI